MQNTLPWLLSPGGCPNQQDALITLGSQCRNDPEWMGRLVTMFASQVAKRHNDPRAVSSATVELHHQPGHDLWCEVGAPHDADTLAQVDLAIRGQVGMVVAVLQFADERPMLIWF